MTITAVPITEKVSMKTKAKIIPIKEEQFIISRQDNIINDLMKIAPKKDSKGKDKFADKESFTNGAVKLEIHKVTGITTNFNTPTKQLLDILIIYHNLQGCNGQITVHLDEFMTIRGITDKKSARKKVNEIIELLCNSFLTCTVLVPSKKKKKKVEKNYNDIPLMETAYIKNSFIIAEFSKQFSEIIGYSRIMPYPLELLKINGQKNPNSFNFLRKLSEHKNMNKGKTNEDIISVKTLLDSSEAISSIEVVRKTNRQINRNIIQPFERDLNNLSNVLTWEYQKKGGIPISENELKTMKYDDRLDLFIKVNWNNYPVQTYKRNNKNDK